MREFGRETEREYQQKLKKIEIQRIEGQRVNALRRQNSERRRQEFRDKYNLPAAEHSRNNRYYSSVFSANDIPFSSSNRDSSSTANSEQENVCCGCCVVS